MKRKELLRWLAIFALLTLFSTGRWALAPVAWVAPALGLYIIHRTATVRGFFLLWAMLFVASGIPWYGAVPFPMTIFMVFMLFNAFMGALPYLIDRVLAPRLGQSFVITLVFPLAVTAIEFLLMAQGPLGSFGAQAYTQSALAPLVQLASITGLWGITFIVSWFAATAHWAVSRYEAGQSFRRGVAVYALILAAILGFGTIRLLTAPQPQSSVALASFTAAHVDMGEMMRLRAQDEAAFRERTRAQHAAYLEQTSQAAQAGAQIVLWPELAGLGMSEDVERLVARGQSVANEHNIYLAMPLFLVDPAGAAPVNKIVVADPEGAIVLEHVKYGGNILEGTQPGNAELQIVETPFGTLSAVICWDIDYPGLVRQAGQQEVDILLSPAYVWPEVAAIHAQMAPFRSIENGLTVVRQSDNGFSLVSDSYGRVVAWENHVGQERVQMSAAVPVLPTQTLYPVLGDVVGQGSIAGMVIAILAVIVRRFRRPQRTQPLATAEAS